MALHAAPWLRTSAGAAARRPLHFAPFPVVFFRRRAEADSLQQGLLVSSLSARHFNGPAKLACCHEPGIHRLGGREYSGGTREQSAPLVQGQGKIPSESASSAPISWRLSRQCLFIGLLAGRSGARPPRQRRPAAARRAETTRGEVGFYYHSRSSLVANRLRPCGASPSIILLA